MTRRGAWRAGIWPLLSLFVSGCSPYALRGKVIEGDASVIMLVDASDPRLKSAGLAGVAVGVVLDPEQLNRKPAGSGVSDARGDFDITLTEFGAGVLEFDAMVTADCRGYLSAETIFPLPGQSRRVLIMMQRGVGPPSTGSENLLDEIRRLQN